jgi:hypothetical protein
VVAARLIPVTADTARHTPDVGRKTRLVYDLADGP